jgi:outer membrane biosynthesis protein TonB
MTDSDDKLLRHYRALPREEPPRALDDAILAASRRAVAARPSLSRRWAGPVSIAAVLVLAFGVTLEMQREQPGIEYKEVARPVPSVAPEPPAAPMQAPQPRAMESDVAPPPPAKRPAPELRQAAPPQVLKEMEPSRNEPQAFPQSVAPAPPPPVAAPPSEPARTQAMPMEAPATLDKFRDANVAPAPAPAAAASGATPAAPAMAAPRAKTEAFDAARAPARALAAPAEPGRELERIAKLREEGRDEEADKALEEFKRRYPAFRIPDATWSRVKPR